METSATCLVPSSHLKRNDVLPVQLAHASVSTGRKVHRREQARLRGVPDCGTMHHPKRIMTAT